jgi:phosphate transport system substrate-binding protein
MPTVLAAMLAAPVGGQQLPPGYVPGTAPETLSGRVIADGSSTVWPITSEIGERFVELAPGVVIEVEVSGTGGGFRRFCAGESDVQNASRPINAEEQAACAAAGVAYHGFEIGYDGITVVVHPSNDFVDCLTVEQLRRLWQPDNPARTWRDLDPAWPDAAIDLYGPGPDSGTFDYFTAAIVGEEGVSRVDYTPSENDLYLVEGVAGDEHALGYFGYAYYQETADRLKAVAIDGGAGCVAPAAATIADGTYRPLSRPIYVYVNAASLRRPEVGEFMRFYHALATEVVAEVGYVPTADATYAANRVEVDGAIAGSVAPDGPGGSAGARPVAAAVA